MLQDQESFRAELAESVTFLKERIGTTPEIGIILGSGLGEIADALENRVAIPYGEIPNFPVSTAPGHSGELIVGELAGKRLFCMQGRFHYYEGYEMERIVYPIYVMKQLGIENLIITNAAGCVNADWNIGELMLISDHIKVVAESPTRGPNDDSFGPRFFDMSDTYTKELRALAKRIAAEQELTIREGVYFLHPGPNFETPAEIRMIRNLGADAVGMSTVPEAITASYLSMKLLGISCLTNMAAGILDVKLTTEEVIETGQKVKGPFIKLLKGIISAWELNK